MALGKSIVIGSKTYVTDSATLINNNVTSVRWNEEYRLGTQTSINITFPAPPTDISANIVITFVAGNNCSVTLTPPSGYKIIGLSDSLHYFSGVQYELDFKVLDASIIRVIHKSTAADLVIDSAMIANAPKITHSSYAFTYTDKPDNNGTLDGFQIVGRSSASSSAASAYAYEMGNYYFEVDLTNYSTLEFYVRKNANHGMCWVRLDHAVPTSTTLGAHVVTLFNIHYNSLATTWTLQTADISNYTGIYYLVFGGGYADASGAVGSSTEYSGITLKV